MTSRHLRLIFAGAHTCLLLGVFTSALGGCREKSSDKPAHQFEKQNMLRAPNDVRLPSKLWDLVAQGIGNEQTEFVAVKVLLVEKTHGALGGHNHEIVFGSGGGEIDLKDYVSGAGSFWLSAELIQKPLTEAGEKLGGEKPGGEKKPEGETNADGPKKADDEKKPEEKKEASAAASGPIFKVFFLSQGKERKLDGLVYGSGCHSYYDISSYFTKAAQKEGLLGLIAGQRYVNTLSGVYFLSLREGDRLQLAQITVSDSRYPALLCDEPAAGANPQSNTKAAHE